MFLVIIINNLNTDIRIQLNYFGHVYKQHPGQCHVHESKKLFQYVINLLCFLPLVVNGSEDIILLPDNDAIISSVRSAIDMMLFQFTIIFDLGSTIFCL